MKKMTGIDFNSLNGNALLLAKEGAAYLGINRRYFYQLELRGFFSRDNKKGDPRYRLKTLKEFRDKAYATGFLPMRARGVQLDIGDPKVKDDEFVTREEVMQYFRISSTCLYEWINRGGFPKPYRLHEGARPKWKVGEVRACLK